MAGAFDDLTPAAPTSGGGAFSDVVPERPASTSKLSGLDRLLKGVRDPIDGGAQLLTNLLPGGLVQAGNRLNNAIADKTGLVGRLPEGGVDQQVREGEATYQAARGTDAGFDGMRVLGNVVSPANLALAARAPQAASLIGRIGTGAVIGGGSAALNPVTNEGDFATEKAKQIASGAAFGGATPVVTGAAGRLISPNASTNPQLAMLRKEGVQPSIGQTLGGTWNRLEEKATSFPLIGDAIAATRARAQNQFNSAAINRATNPIGVRIDQTGQEGVRRAGEAVGDAYDAARNAMGSFQLDPQATGQLAQLRTMAANLPAKERGMFDKTWQTIHADISPNGTIDASVFKRIDSKLGKDAAQFAGSTDAYQQNLGAALNELKKAISDAARRANPKADAMFSAADRAYANLVRVEGASKAAIGNEGVFTPGQLNTAVRQSDKSVRDRATARGTALMQDLSGAGQSVLGNRVPNSGTVDRAMLLGTGAGAFANPLLTGAGLLGGAALYTQPVQSLLRGAVTARHQSAEAVRQSLLKASPRLLPLGAQVGLGLLD